MNAVKAESSGTSNRRSFIAKASALGAASFLGLPRPAVAERPPETTTIRIGNARGFVCVAPQWVAQELLRLEGITDVRYVELTEADIRRADAVNTSAFAEMSARGGMDFLFINTAQLPFTMDAGVPIKAPVSGVAMGLITDDTGRYKILTDIQGTEDHLGDMDFKVAGTAAGITALQMDIKISGLSTQMMKEALEQAHTARMSIMDKMLAVLPESRAELKEHAPRIITVKIPVDKIGALIGPGGKNIRALQEETGVKIDIEEDGTVYIASTNSAGAKIAQERIAGLGENAVIGNIYTGKVVRIADFGAFVEILPGMDGLVHISQLASERVNKVEDVVGMGDEITVMVTDVDPQGKIRLSRQAVLEGWTAAEAREKDGPRKPSGGGNRGGGDRGGRGGDRGGNRGGGDRGGRR